MRASCIDFPAGPLFVVTENSSYGNKTHFRYLPLVMYFLRSNLTIFLRVYENKSLDLKAELGLKESY